MSAKPNIMTGNLDLTTLAGNETDNYIQNNLTIDGILTVDGVVYHPGTGFGSVTQVDTGTGLTGGPITVNGTISLANTGVTAGTYTNTTLTVNAQGQLTAVSNGVVEANVVSFNTRQGDVVLSSLDVTTALGYVPGTAETTSVVTLNGFSGTVANASSNPAITLNCTVSGVLKGDGTTMSAAVAGYDFIPGAAGLTNGILYNTFGNPNLSIAVPADFPTLNQDTTGTATYALHVPYSGLTGSVPTWNQNTTGISAGLSGGTAGSLPYQSATDTTAMLGIGAAGKVLTVSGGLPVWASPAAADQVDVYSTTSSSTFYPLMVNSPTSGSPSQINYNLTNLSFTPSSGTLFVGGPTYSPNFVGALSGNATSATNLAGGTTGSLPYQSAANTTSLLPVGSNGQILQVVSGNPSWVNFTGGVSSFNGRTGSVTLTSSDVQSALAPTVANTFLEFNGTSLVWNSSIPSAGGITGSVQFNNGGVLTGNALLTYDGYADLYLGSPTDPAGAGTMTVYGGPTSGYAGAIVCMASDGSQTAFMNGGSPTASSYQTGGNMSLAVVGGTYNGFSMFGGDGITYAGRLACNGLNQNGNFVIQGGTNSTGNDLVTFLAETTSTNDVGISFTAANNGDITMSRSSGYILALKGDGSWGVGGYTSVGTSGQVLTSGGPGTSPTWESVPGLTPTTGSSILYGNGSGGFANATVGSGLTFTGGTLSSTAGGGSVTSTSVVTANGFSGTVATATSTPAITLNTTVSGVLKGNGSAMSAAVAGTDYSAGTSALSTGILKSTTSTGALSIAVAADFPILNQNTTGNAATATNVAYSGLTGTVPTWNQNTTGNAATASSVPYSGLTGTVPTWNQNTTGHAATVITNANLTGDVTSVGNATTLSTTGVTAGTYTNTTMTVDAKGRVTSATSGATPPTGTVTSVAMTVPSFLTVTGSPITSSGTLAVTAASTSQNYFLAGPTSGSGSPTMRLIVPGDIPTLNQNTTGNAATATNVAYSGLTGTVPTWNQNTTGNAATATTANATATGNSFQMGSLGVGTPASGTVGEIRATNNVTAYYSSDRRLKENIIPITNALDKVMALSGNTYDWTQVYIDSHGGEDGYFVRKQDVGVIAQEVEVVLPQATATREDGFMAVNYEKLVPLLIEAIKEQQALIQALQAKVGL